MSCHKIGEMITQLEIIYYSVISQEPGLGYILWNHWPKRSHTLPQHRLLPIGYPPQLESGETLLLKKSLFMSLNMKKLGGMQLESSLLLTSILSAGIYYTHYCRTAIINLTEL